MTHTHKRITDLTNKSKYRKINDEGLTSTVYINIKKRVIIKDFCKPGHSIENYLCNANSEIKVMEQIKQNQIPHVIQIKEFFFPKKYPKDGLPQITMEFATGGNLLNLIRRKALTPEACSKVIKQLTTALTGLHKYNIIHCDIKLENVLLDINGNVKLADFGFARAPKEGARTVGSSAYAAPEIIRRLGIAPCLNTKDTDIYSLTILSWELLTRTIVTDWIWDELCRLKAAQLQLEDFIESGKRPDINKAPRKYHELIDWGWSQLPERRPTASLFLAKLEQVEKEEVSTPRPG